ncbi:MAG: hypothetical protein L6R38_001807 [Xanthoria sp. 2 TBL-2021]|nr:MAG: hypothetical protein L6R38_001807 [Xanthoria sp. 2 TBL-2021]
MDAAIFPFEGVQAQCIVSPGPNHCSVVAETSADLQNELLHPRISAIAASDIRLTDGGRVGEDATTETCASEACAAGARTPPINIIRPSHIEATRKQHRHRTTCNDELQLKALQMTDKLHPTGSNRKKKKRNNKKGKLAALNHIEGSVPASSEDERAAFPKQTLRGGDLMAVSAYSSLASSPGNRSSSPCPGVSALSQQLEALECTSELGHPPGDSRSSRLRIKTNLNYLVDSQSTIASVSPNTSPTASHSSATSESIKDGDGSKTISYEVALEHDFISPDVPQTDSGSYQETPTLDHVVRKMTASDFTPLRCLGTGTYGTVILVKQARTGRLFAQKQFRKASLTVKQQLVEQTNTERAILESINRHPYVVKLYYAFQDQEKLYLILEYAQGGELFTRMMTEGMFPEEIAAFYMAEMILALDHLHNTVGVVYRDLKPENCLLDADGHLLLTDFGLSKVAVDGDYRCRSMTGTLEYMAPEVIQQQSYGPEVDWWSFAVLGFEMLAGASPFRAPNDAKIQEKIVKTKLVLPFFMSVDAKDLLTRLLRKKPKERLGARMPKDLQIIKGHRFFRKIDWNKLQKRQVEPPFKPIVTNPELAENFAAEFTDRAVSPVTTHPKHDWGGLDSASDPFGGFSFVASRSLLAHDSFF